MDSIKSKIKPASGFSHFVHLSLSGLLPGLVFVLVRLDFVGLATVLILLSKWRMLAVKPRHWLAHFRANGVDLTVGLSFLIFMIHTNSPGLQLIWAGLYGIWLVVIKPRSGVLGVSSQAVIAQFLGLTALFLHWGDASILALVILGWLVCYSAARHFFTSFDEPLTRYLSDAWAYFGAAVVWVLGHWLLFYGVIAQPTLILTVVGFGLSGIYYLEQADKLSAALRRQIVFVMMAVLIIVLTFSDWGDKAI